MLTDLLAFLNLGIHFDYQFWRFKIFFFHLCYLFLPLKLDLYSAFSLQLLEGTWG